MPTYFRLIMIPALILSAYCATASTEAIPPASWKNGGPPEAANLSQQLTREFRADPLFQYMKISIDLYKGLAIVHGGAPSREMVDVVTQKLREKPGVSAVYNYMSNPDERTPVANSIAVTYETFNRMQDVGMNDNAFTIAGRVTRRLEADPVLSRFDIEVDTYLGLVILHGTVDAPQLIERAKNIARYTEGVEAVLSYVNADQPVAPMGPRSTPIVTREVYSAPIPVTNGNGGCCH